jgi:Na+/melibiose symporter-like transporter
VSFVGGIPDVSSFDVKIEAAQAKDTLFKMRALFVFFPIVVATGILLLVRFYPLNEQRRHEIRQKFEARRGIIHAK